MAVGLLLWWSAVLRAQACRGRMGSQACCHNVSNTFCFRQYTVCMHACRQLFTCQAGTVPLDVARMNLTCLSSLMPTERTTCLVGLAAVKSAHCLTTCHSGVGAVLPACVKGRFCCLACLACLCLCQSSGQPALALGRCQVSSLLHTLVIGARGLCSRLGLRGDGDDLLFLLLVSVATSTLAAC